MPEINEGLEKMRDTVSKIKSSADVQSKLPSLDTVVNQDTLALLQSFSEKGIQDMGMNQGMPVLRVHSASSTKNTLANGSQPKIGSFFYTATKEELVNPVVRLLAVKKCMLPKMKEREYDPEELKANYVIAGVIIDTNAPFVMYINGLSYNKVWALMDQLKPWVKGMKIPMFSLHIRLSTQMEQDQGKKYAPKPVTTYGLVMGKNDFPVVETNRDTIMELAKQTDQATQAINDMTAQMLEKHGFKAPMQILRETSNRFDEEEDRSSLRLQDEVNKKITSGEYLIPEDEAEEVDLPF